MDIWYSFFARAVSYVCKMFMKLATAHHHQFVAETVRLRFRTGNKLHRF